MRFFLSVFLGIVFPAMVWAQNGVITGKVISTDLQMPLGRANVFLSNATFGTATLNDGTFIMRDVKPGQYELVVTYVGYETYYKTIMVGSAPIQLNIEMHLKSTAMGEVLIVAHKFNKENFDKFLKDFIGTSDNAKKCKVVNPKAVDLVYHTLNKVLEGHSDEFLIIDNKALGYRIKFLLNDFKSDYINNIISYSGKVLYEELKSNKAQAAKWHKKREEAYYGSSMHFFRSLLYGHLGDQGFLIRRLFRKPNPKRPPQLIIQQKMDKFYAEQNRDSLNYWKGMYDLPKYNETLIREPMNEMEVVRRTNTDGVFAITFPDYLYVTYTKKLDEFKYSDIYRPLDMVNYLTSIITLYKPYALFDMNGVVISPQSTLYEGAWSRDKIAELLPVDYAPDTAIKK